MIVHLHAMKEGFVRSFTDEINHAPVIYENQ